jgi:zinc protease
MAHYRARYSPNGATLVVAGDVDVGVVCEKVQRAYGHIRGHERPADAAPRRVRQSGERRKVLRFATPTEKLLVGWHAPPFVHRDHAALVVTEQLLAGGRSARLWQRLVRKDEIASDVRMSVAPFVHDTLADLWASAREGVRASRLLHAVDEEIERLGHKGPSDDELEKVKNRLELGFLGALETVPGKAEQRQRRSRSGSRSS